MKVPYTFDVGLTRIRPVYTALRLHSKGKYPPAVSLFLVFSHRLSFLNTHFWSFVCGIMQFFIATAVALAALTTAAPAPGHVLHEKRHALDSKWVKRSRLPGGAILPMKIGLAQNGIQTAENWLYEM